MAKRTVEDVDVNGKRVLMRVDFNVPLDEQQHMTDDTRIRASLPTIQYLMEQSCKLVLMSHLGRPKGERRPEMSLAPAASRLTELLGKPVEMLSDCIGDEVEQTVAAMKGGDVVLLENLRFHPEEEKNDGDFARALAGLADVYVNDAFGAAHRAHASTAGMAHFVAERAAGFLLQLECDYLSRVLAQPERPLVAILGGAKVSDKIPVIRNLLQLVDVLLIGGAMAYTFLRTQGHETGESLVEEDQLSLAKELLRMAAERKVPLLLPSDHVVAEKPEEGVPATTVHGDIPPGTKGLDIGPETIEAFRREIAKGETIFWNGPLGMFEVKPPKPPTPATFTTSALTISPNEVNTGESVTIGATVANIGDVSGMYQVTFKIDGIVVQTKNVTLDEGTSLEVIFKISTDVAGTYTVDVDGLRGAFTVREEVPAAPLAPAVPQTPTPFPSPTPAPAPEANWWLIIGVIGGVAVVVLVSYFLVRKCSLAVRTGLYLNISRLSGQKLWNWFKKEVLKKQ